MTNRTRQHAGRPATEREETVGQGRVIVHPQLKYGLPLRFAGGMVDLIDFKSLRDGLRTVTTAARPGPLSRGKVVIPAIDEHVDPRLHDIRVDFVAYRVV